MVNEEKNKLMVVKSNYLVEASYRLTITEQKIMYMIISQINKTDTNFKDYEFRVNDFINLLRLKGQSAYTDLKASIRLLRSRTFTVKYSINDKSKELITGWIINAEYEQGVLKFNIDPKLKPFLVQLKREFTTMSLNNLMQLKSTYSTRIYELLKQYLNIGERTFYVEELKKLLAIPEGEYKLYSHFKSRVILKPQSELKEKTDISFDFAEIKEKRKVTAIKFYIKPNIQAQNEISATQMDAELKSQKEKISEDEAFGVKRVKELINEHDVTELEALKILKSAKGDFAVIQKVYNHFKNKQSDNFVGLMVSMVKPGVFQKPKFNAPKTTFNDYEQRHYDYNELEKGLTGEKEINLREITSQ